MLRVLGGMVLLWASWVVIALVVLAMGGCTSHNARGNPACVTNCTATIGGV